MLQFDKKMFIDGKKMFIDGIKMFMYYSLVGELTKDLYLFKATMLSLNFDNEPQHKPNYRKRCENLDVNILDVMRSVWFIKQSGMNKSDIELLEKRYTVFPFEHFEKLLCYCIYNVNRLTCDDEYKFILRDYAERLEKNGDVHACVCSSCYQK